MKTWKPEMHVHNEWASNALVFATHEEAMAYARDLFSRWTSTVGYRAVESDAPVTHRWNAEKGKAESL